MRRRLPHPSLPHSPSRRAFLSGVSGAAVTGITLMRSARAQVAAAPGALLAYVGTYSAPPAPAGAPASGGNNGRGVHVFAVDRTTGALTPAGIVTHHGSPSALAFHRAGTHVYTTNATDVVDDGTSGSISAYAVDRGSGQLQLLNTVSSGGLGPTDVSVHPAGRHVLVANYSGGTVAVFPLLQDGRLGRATDVRKTEGRVGPTRATSAPPGSFAFSGHDAPHPHMIQADPAGRFVLSADLGLDCIFVWRFDASLGTLTAANPPSVTLPPGDGPRHFAFHPNGRWLYSIQEEGSTVVLFDYDARTGRLTPRHSVSSLPPGHAGSNFTSGIKLSHDGRFVYAANRLHDSIAIFAVGADGRLAFVADEWTRGDYPRSFSFDPGGRFLYSCNQRADAVTTFRVDRESGRLTFTGQYTPVGSPSAIEFLDLRD